MAAMCMQDLEIFVKTLETVGLRMALLTCCAYSSSRASGQKKKVTVRLKIKLS
jgi:hypothetical protein